MILPQNCNSKHEIRQQIDFIDKQIIELLNLRFGYVKEIVKYKSDAESINANERVVQVINQRRQWAEENGLNPDVIESIFRLLVNYFISEEHKIFRKE